MFVLFFNLLTTCTVELYIVNRLITEHAQIFGGGGIRVRAAHKNYQWTYLNFGLEFLIHSN